MFIDMPYNSEELTQDMSKFECMNKDLKKDYFSKKI